MKSKVIASVFAAAVSLAGAERAAADPAFGFGFTFIFGGDWAFGVRVFSDDGVEQGALSLGLDYKFGSQSFRPNVGIAYLDEDVFLDLTLGFDLETQLVDYGFGLGWRSDPETTSDVVVAEEPGSTDLPL